jgi:hypothetical protein
MTDACSDYHESHTIQYAHRGRTPGAVHDQVPAPSQTSTLLVDHRAPGVHLSPRCVKRYDASCGLRLVEGYHACQLSSAGHAGGRPTQFNMPNKLGGTLRKLLGTSDRSDHEASTLNAEASYDFAPEGYKQHQQPSKASSSTDRSHEASATRRQQEAASSSGSGQAAAGDLSRRASMTTSSRVAHDTAQPQEQRQQQDVQLTVLVEQLRHGDSEQRGAAAEALFNAAADSELVRCKAVALGAVRPLVQLLRDGTDHGKMFAAYTLSAVASAEPAINQMVGCGAVPALLALLSTNPTLICQKGAVRALSRLSRSNEAVADIVAHDGITTIVTKLRHSDNSLVRRCLVSLYFIGADKDHLQQQIGTSGAIPPLLALTASADAEVQAEATDVLKVLSRNSWCAQHIEEQGGKAQLRAVAEKGTSSRAKASAARALQRMAAHRDAANNLSAPCNIQPATRHSSRSGSSSQQPSAPGATSSTSSSRSRSTGRLRGAAAAGDKEMPSASAAAAAAAGGGGGGGASTSSSSRSNSRPAQEAPAAAAGSVSKPAPGAAASSTASDAGAYSTSSLPQKKPTPDAQSAAASVGGAAMQEGGGGVNQQRSSRGAGPSGSSEMHRPSSTDTSSHKEPSGSAGSSSTQQAPSSSKQDSNGGREVAPEASDAEKHGLAQAGSSSSSAGRTSSTSRQQVSGPSSTGGNPEQAAAPAPAAAAGPSASEASPGQDAPTSTSSRQQSVERRRRSSVADMGLAAETSGPNDDAAAASAASSSRSRSVGRRRSSAAAGLEGGKGQLLLSPVPSGEVAARDRMGDMNRCVCVLCWVCGWVLGWLCQGGRGLGGC